jgi:hypothetical protein
MLLLVLILMPIGVHSTPAHAQDSDSIGKVYFVTAEPLPDDWQGGWGETADIIWELDTATGTTRELLRIEPRIEQTARELFSEREFQLLEEHEPEMLDWNLLQDLEAITVLNAEQVLVVTSNSVRIFDMGFPFYGYGFYKIQILNLSDGSLTPLLTLDFHLDDMPGDCLFPSGIRLVNFNTNPVMDIFGFTVAPVIDDSYCGRYSGDTYLVDYSTLPVQMKVISNARQYSWSPDGDKIAFAGLTETHSIGYYVGWSDFDVPSTLMFAGYGGFGSYGSAPVFLVTWLNSHTVLYQYKKAILGDSAAVGFEAYDLWSGQIVFSRELNEYNTAIQTLGYLDDGQTHLVYAQNQDGTLFLYYTPEGELVQRQTQLREPIDGRSRLNAASFLGWRISPLMRRSDRMISRLDLSPYIPEGHELRFIAN